MGQPQAILCRVGHPKPTGRPTIFHGDEGTIAEYRDLLKQRMRRDLGEGMSPLERMRTFRDRDRSAHDYATAAIEYIMAEQGITGACFDGNGEILLISAHRLDEAYDIYAAIKAGVDEKLRQHDIPYEFNAFYSHTHAESVRRELCSDHRKSR